MKKTKEIVPVENKQLSHLQSENQQLKKQLEMIEAALDEAEEQAYLAGYEDALLEQERTSQALNDYLNQAVEVFEQEYQDYCMGKRHACTGHSKKAVSKSKKK